MMQYVSCGATEDDVIDLAEQLEVDPEVAKERAEQWAKYIADTVQNLLNEQLSNVIKWGQP